MRAFAATAVMIGVLGLGAGTAEAASITLYGGNGGHNDGTSQNDGSLVIVDQTDASISVVGHPGSIARLTGLAFGSSTQLWGSTLPSFAFPPPPPASSSSLVQIDPDTGALLSAIAITSVTGLSLSIADLAVQPSTGTIFGVSGPNGPGPANLFTINPTTGISTLVGAVGGASFASFASIGFAPDGTLYASVAGFANGPINPRLVTINPLTGAFLSSLPTADFFGAFGIRPTDGAIFGGTGDEHELFMINAVTGAETLVGDTGLNYVGDLAFRPVPEPATLMLLGSGLVAAIARRRRGRSHRPLL